MFGRATITLGIDPHSSCDFLKISLGNVATHLRCVLRWKLLSPLHRQHSWKSVGERVSQSSLDFADVMTKRRVAWRDTSLNIIPPMLRWFYRASWSVQSAAVASIQNVYSKIPWSHSVQLSISSKRALSQVRKAKVNAWPCVYMHSECVIRHRYKKE